MLFTSIKFIIFFPVVVLIFYLLPHRFRWSWLLLASCFFYMTFTPYYIFLLMAIVVIEYSMALLIEKQRAAGKGDGKIFLLAGIIIPLVLLSIFKYFNFLSITVSQIAQFFSLKQSPVLLEIILPVGISFYTFQGLSYIIDVYRGTFKAHRHFGIFTLFMTFFPQLLAGPIPRAPQLIPQFYEEKKFDYEQFTDGLKLIAWGFFKKLVIADRAAVVVNEVFNNTHDYWGIYFIIATFFFCFQVYCDFSGYSDIAIGGALLLGYRLQENFRRPYLSESIQEVWRRWNISLLSWFRDYLYIPLGGNRVSAMRKKYNTMVIFVISGIWHGANWTYIIWASLNGLYILISQSTREIRKSIVSFLRFNRIPRIYKVFRVLCTFVLFYFAAIFFRANSVSDAVYMISHFFTGIDEVLLSLATFNYEAIKTVLIVANKKTILGFARPIFLGEIIILCMGIIILNVIYVLQETQSIKQRLKTKPAYVTWVLCYGLCFFIIFLGYFSSQPFLYFRH